MTISKTTGMHPDEEAIVLCRYLTGETPGKNILENYWKAVALHASPLSVSQEKTWKRCMQHPGLLPLADAAWAWNDPLHPLRHRIFIMLSTLETHRSYQHYFLPVSRKPAYKFFIALLLVRSGFRLIAGKIILWFL
jgi:hypothetical protein